jgi:hypothetical protein
MVPTTARRAIFGVLITLLAPMFAFQSVSAQEATPAADLPFGNELDAWTPVIVSPVDTQTAAVRGSDGRYHIVYDLMLTNVSSSDADIESIAILNAEDGQAITSFSAAELVSNEVIRTLDRAPASDATLEANASRLLMVTTTFAELDAVPAAISHSFDVRAIGSFSTEPEIFTYRAGVIDLSGAPAPVVAAPLQGSGWIAAEGCCLPVSHHVNGVFPVNGTLYAGQRFAIDFIKLNEDGELWTDDPFVATNWEGYGQPIAAAAGGTVVDAYGGAKDETPTIFPDMSQLTPNENLGNYLVIRHDDGFYGVYGHLKPGSLNVEVGDRVETGDVIALVGNTGGSQAPHLHFEIIDTAIPAMGNGYPYAFERFMVAGYADPEHLLEALEVGFTYEFDRSDTTEHHGELPLSYVIVDFPAY